MQDADTAEVDDVFGVQLTLGNVRGLTTVLQAIKPGAKQVCSVVVAKDGLTLRWEDDSKTLQSSVYIKSELFSGYACPLARTIFGVHFTQLVDTLSVFASSSDAPLLIKYPGPDGELQLEMRDDSGIPVMCSYARLQCVEQTPGDDLSDHWQDPASYFLAPGMLLKEAVDDLEWPGGPVTLLLQRDPAAIRLSASGNGSLEIELDPRALSGFHCSSDACRASYGYKQLRAALCNIPAHKDPGSVASKVSVDSSGLLKVTHMMAVLGGGGGGGATAAAAAHTQLSTPAAPLRTQGALDSSRAGVVQYIMLPLEEEG